MKTSEIRKGAASRCKCGHNGDVTGGRVIGVAEVEHAGVIGHGPCLVDGCPCEKFTWADFLDSAKFRDPQ